METFGYLKLFTRVITHKDRHGREQGKRVTLLSRHCEHKNIDKYVGEFMQLNPSFSHWTYLEMEFTVREAKVLSDPQY